MASGKSGDEFCADQVNQDVDFLGDDIDDEEEDDSSLKDYYGVSGDDDLDEADTLDPEHFVAECLSVDAVECLLNEWVEELSNRLRVTPSLAKQLLQRFHWDVEDIVQRHSNDPSSFMTEAHIKPNSARSTSSSAVQQMALASPSECPVCAAPSVGSGSSSGADVQFSALVCGHAFCRDCWSSHLQVQLTQGVSSSIACMWQKCSVLVPEDFAAGMLGSGHWRQRYQQYVFSDCVKTHPQLRFCPGPNCCIIIRARHPCPKRVICSSCKTSFCFMCGTDYHAPAECDVIRRWMTKCADDSETANYISANTKDCPRCHICIEKNGGCNHMQCFNCKFEFCWMCLSSWSTHGSEYYECSRYKENPNIVNESAHAKAREALKKYLHYYERWENHSRSLSLEAQTRQKIADRIKQKVNDSSGTWIDWHYLLGAAALLAKCRYTLQYTYPFAYYLDAGPRKELFEYQQAQLEADIENLSWKVERAESADRGALENHMSRVERSRSLLLREFLDTN